MDGENSHSDEEQIPQIRGEIEIGDDNEENVMKILLATDIHLGFKENDPILGDDSFRAFEEILQIAVEKEVDFLLLGGDLFHNACPSPSCLLRCTQYLKKYCLGDRPISTEMLSDLEGKVNLNENEPLINYEDPNLNIQLPILSIHGNHDDPTGQHHTSVMDVISSSGLVNYFGKWKNHTEVQVKPVLLKKGCTNVALYGLSHIKDERLGRLLLDGKISYEETPNDWFKMLVWHQNRNHRGTKNFISDQNLPEFLDFVLWGHEHDCRIIPERMPNDVYVVQPGSSVATSLSQGESMTKHVALLKIYKTAFDLQPIPLKTVRPFIYEDIFLKSSKDAEDNVSQDAQNQVERALSEMLEKVKRTGTDLLPLIRLNVRYTDELQVFNMIRFGHKYIGEVANPSDMIKFVSNVKTTTNRSNKTHMNDDDEVNNPAVTLEDLILNYFEKNPVIECLSVAELTQEVMKSLGTDDDTSIDSYVKDFTKELVKKLEEKQATEDEIDAIICHTKVKQEADKSGSRIHSNDDDDDEIVLVEEDSDGEELNRSVVKPTGRGKRGTTRARGGRGRGRRGKTTTVV